MEGFGFGDSLREWANVDVRYLISIASAGAELRAEREKIARAVLTMGHVPVDLTGAGVLEHEAPEAVERYIARSDYFIVIVADEDEDSAAELRQLEVAYGYAGQHEVPVLGLVVGDSGPVGLIDQIRENSIGMTEDQENIGESAGWLLIKMIQAYGRPGWMSTTELPSGEVASELARLSRENTEYREQLRLVDPEGSVSEDQRLESSIHALHENKILIPLWERTTNTWEKPFEVDLYNFFVRIAPELAVEASANDIASFIPSGVCEMDAEDVRARWVVPPASLNLWFTDLMSLGLMAPSPKRHGPKDNNQYWTLTGDGRELLSRVRRSVLEMGGHRHVGFTQEFRIPIAGD